MTPAAAIPPDDDPLRLLAPLRRQLRALPEGEASDELRPQLEQVASAVTALLLTASAPLPAPLRVLAQTLSEIYGLWLDRLTGPAAANEALRCLVHQLMLAQLTHSQPPAGLWSRAVALAPLGSPQQGLLGALLALSVVQPESHTPRALWLLRGLLLREGQLVSLRQTPPDKAEGWHWIDLGSYGAGLRLHWTRPSLGAGEVLFFDCSPLAVRAEALAQEIALDPEHPALREAPMPAAEAHAALRRVAEQWQHPAQRRFGRRRPDLRVQLCARLDQLWSAMSEDDQVKVETSDWVVLNESAGGYALMHSSGPVSGLQAGNALGLRLPGKPWSLGLVRWIRSENSAHVELGIELLTPAASPVRLAADGQEPQAAFLLPAMEGLGRSEALLATRHVEAVTPEFVMLSEKDGQLRISRCRRGPPTHQTGAIEVFGFERVQRDG